MATTKIDKPDFIEDKHLEFLDSLRETGITNMYGAGIYLMHQFDIERKNASKILSYWMKSFSERHP